MDLQKEREREREYFKKFLNKKVEIEYSRGIDILRHNGKMKGTIKEHPHPDEKGRIIFVKQRCTRSFYDITLGLFDGFHATLNIKNITIL